MKKNIMNYKINLKTMMKPIYFEKFIKKPNQKK